MLLDVFEGSGVCCALPHPYFWGLQWHAPKTMCCLLTSWPR